MVWGFFRMDFGTQHGPQIAPKWTPGASQDALAAQFLPDAVSEPFFVSFALVSQHTCTYDACFFADAYFADDLIRRAFMNGMDVREGVWLKHFSSPS